MNLYMVHVGYYDPSIGEGLYEVHMNFFTAAEDPKKAKENVLSLKEFQDKKMHIDGIQELNIIDGYRIKLEAENIINDINNFSYDDVKNI